MKHPIKLIATLLMSGLSSAAHAACDRYQNDTLTLNMPATVTVPASLPVGAEIFSGTFSGTAQAFTTNCPTWTLLTITGRYQTKDPGYPAAYRTEAPGVGVRLSLTDALGITYPFSMHNQQGRFSGPIHSFTGATLKFYKTGPVTDGTLPAGAIRVNRMDNTPESFTLLLGNAVRFVSPAATCDLATGDVNRTIALDPVKVSTLQNATFAGARDFELTAICQDASQVTFRFSGAPAGGNNALFANTGTAGGVALWLYSRINGAVQNINADGTSDTRTVEVSGDRAVLPLGAAYHANGTVSQGTLLSTATVNITYN